MNTFFRIFGALSLVLIVLGAGYLYYTYSKYNEYELEVKAIVPELLAGMTTENIDFGRVLVNENDKNKLGNYRVLGAYIDCPEKSGNSIEISSTDTPLAEIDVFCRFENSDARIRITLERLKEAWELKEISASSDIFKAQ